MAGFRYVTGRLAAGAIAGVLTLLLAVAGMEPARATSEVGPLKLSKSSGPVDTRVEVSADGFGECEQYVVEAPQPNALVLREAYPGTVQITFDKTTMGNPVTVKPDGSISTAFDVPATMKPGTHTVEAKCVQNPDLVASAEFTVTEVEEPAIVPNLGGMTRDEAKKALELEKLVLGQTTGDGETVQSQQPLADTRVPIGSAVDVDFGTVQPTVVVPRIVGLSRDAALVALGKAELRLGRVSGRGDVVRSQDPVAGTKVTPGSAVDITVGSVTRLVVVPRVIRKTTKAAAEILAKRGLVLGPVNGDGELIRKQFPQPGTEVPVGSAVSVTTGTVLPVLVKVPNVVGRTVDAARTTLTGARLVLGGQLAGDRTVASQKPVAGTFVKPRSVVTVTLVPIPMVRVPDLVGGGAEGARTALAAVGLLFGAGSDSDGKIVSQQPAAGALVPLGTTIDVIFDPPPPTWPAAAVLAALLLGAGAVIYRLARLRLDQIWVRNKVEVVARQSALHGPAITESKRSPAMPVVRIEPHADTGTHTLTEV